MTKRIRLPPGLEGRPRLDGLKLIAQYLQLHPNKVRQLYAVTVPQADRLPVWVFSAQKSKNSVVRAFVDELDSWLDKQSQESHPTKK